ncbi:MAG: rRNA maturation RNase YbeY [Tenericutes bacterium HGW-Tenericutes-3]|nr:MAG: rRNA maturation RNase YbeY [Tenericutes bacterium HGW-Tenericutes-3]
MKIQLHNQTKEDIKAIKDLLQKIFKNIKQDKNMQIIFLEQDAIHQMNLMYRKIDRPTDVLSFINDEVDDDSLGDIFISIEQARIQASDYGHSFEREIGFLAVHGYLHLLGYDHHTDEEEKVMIEEQERILKNANLERN